MFKYVFSKEGYKELQSEMADTMEQLKKTMKEKGEAGRGSDGWHDEGFKACAVREAMLSKRLGELQQLASDANVVEPEEQSAFVRFGTGVIVEYEDGTERNIVMGGYQIGRLKGVVSVHGPLGKALVGASIGEERVFRVGELNRKVKVKKIIPPSEAMTFLKEE